MSRLSKGMAGRPNSLDEAVVFLSLAGDVRLEPDLHAGRTLVISDTPSATRTIRLPKAIGSGDSYTIVNNAVLTNTVRVQTTSPDVLSGTAFVRSETAGSTDVFHTASGNNTYSLNTTTSGGLRGDKVELIDIAAGTWLVRIEANGSGTLATGFATL